MNGYVNGKAKDQVKSLNGYSQSEAEAIARKKIKCIEEEQEDLRTTRSAATMPNNEEIFHDTCAQPVAHSRQKQVVSNSKDNQEHVLIYDGQSNSSISQTAKDQFAAALLRLQSGLDESTRRLKEVESKVEGFIKQQQRNQQQSLPKEDKNKSKKGLGLTLLYLGWPILVFLAMRTIERRNSLGTTMASTASA